ncbi:glycosyltransferase family 2 protein [Vibrio mimicus]
MPIFSVIIPTYNRAQMLTKAVSSIKKQTVSDFEIIIINDSKIPLPTSMFDDKRISIINSCREKGPAFCRNVGLKIAKGEYVSFLDDDDYFEPTFMQETRATLKDSDNSIGMSWSGANFIQGGQLTRVYSPTLSANDRQTLLDEFLSVGTGFGVTFKKDCLLQIGLFDESYRYIEDTELFIRALEHGYSPTHIPVQLINILDHSNDRQTNADNFSKRISECRKLIESKPHFFNTNQRMKDQINWTIVDLESQLETKAIA